MRQAEVHSKIKKAIFALQFRIDAPAKKSTSTSLNSAKIQM